MLSTDLPWTALSGWFQVGWGEVLTADEVTRLRYFGCDLVAWRDEEGAPVVADAYCPHMGAHLGFGGSVIDGCVRCPLHGWTWGSDGCNVAIPFSQATSDRRLRLWPTEEFRGALFVWHDPLGRSPWYNLLDELSFSGATQDTNAMIQGGFPNAAHLYPSVSIHPLIAIEDRVDVDHFAGPHATVPPELLSLELRKHSFSSVVTLAGEGEKIGTRIESLAIGIGVSWLSIEFASQTTDIMLSVTPVAEGESDILHTVWCRSEPATANAAELELRSVVSMMRQELEQDLVVWAHLKYSREIPEEHFQSAASLKAVRAWAQRFFPAEVDWPDGNA